MRGHMLLDHLLLPAAVFVGLIAAGLPVATAFGLGMAVGCTSMVAMMVTGRHRHHQHVPTMVPRSSHQAHGDSSPRS